MLRPILSPFGYALVETSQGKGSGGLVATGRWVAGERVIETHVRWALGIVVYRWGDLELTHQEFLRVRGLDGAYPGFSDDPMDGFRHLAADLAGPARPLLACDHSEFAAMVEIAGVTPTRRLP